MHRILTNSFVLMKSLSLGPGKELSSIGVLLPAPYSGHSGRFSSLNTRHCKVTIMNCRKSTASEVNRMLYIQPIFPTIVINVTVAFQKHELRRYNFILHARKIHSCLENCPQQRSHYFNDKCFYN